jgi:transposase-like protein
VERFPKTLLEFQRLFPDDATCLDYLVQRRWPNGFACPRCRSTDAWRLAARPLWECRGCGRQTSITAGTLLAKSKLPLRFWFWAAHLMATHSNGVSALQLKQQFAIPYSTAWLLEAKLRRAMVNPERSKLAGLVELDQTEIPFREQNPPLGVGGRTGMITVAGLVEVVDRQTGATPRWTYGSKLLGTRASRIRLQVIPDNTAATLEAFVQANVEPGSIILSDDHRSFAGLQRLGYQHDPRTIKLMAAHVVLPWVHRVFALVKRWGLGVYHGLRRKHIQSYLDEYCFRFNRRFNRRKAFETILALATNSPPKPYHTITRTKPRDNKKDKARRIDKQASTMGRASEPPNIGASS